MKAVKRIVSFIIVAATLFGHSLPVIYADEGKQAEQPDILRVAYYPLEGFFEYDVNGTETGYGVDMLNKISQYTGIQFKYVYTDSWEKTGDMLLKGEADIRMPVTMPITPSYKFSYCSESIIETCDALLTLDSKENLYYQDDDAIRTLKIAVAAGNYNNTDIKEFFAELGIDEDQLVVCDDYNGCYDLLVSGEVDALASNIMDMKSNMKIIAESVSMGNYIAAVYNDPIVEILDKAIDRIRKDEPLFFANLYDRWFPERTAMPMTQEEIKYLAEIDELTFAFRSDEGYLSRYEDGEYYGIYVEIAKSICEKLGVGYRGVSFEACLVGEETADVYSGFFYDYNYAEQWNFAITDPIRNTNYYVIQKKETVINEAECKVAAIEQFRYTHDYIMRKYNEDQIIYFDTYEECLNAVERGNADITVINNYIAEYYLERYRFGDLSIRLAADYSHLFCLAVPDNNKELAAILSNAVSQIRDEEMNRLYIKGTEKKFESDFFLSLLYGEPLEFALIAAMTSVLIIIFILVLIFFSRSKKQNKSLATALSSKSDFLARMSHDMRTPLNAILGYARLAQDEKEDSASVQDSLSKILSSGEYLLGIINDILNASKIENESIELHEEIVDCTEFFEEISGELKAQGSLDGITLITDLENMTTPFAKMDKLHTRQIYTNLLNNAFKFSKAGTTVEWTISSSMTDERHMEYVSVIRDHGCGMSKEFMKHMFEPFTQERLDGQDIQGGTGLGLTIVKKFIEVSGGTIEVKSELGEGTVFTVHMACDVPTEEELAELSSREQGVPADHSCLEGKRILLCEDHPLNREITVRVLEKVGIITECAENGRAGTEMFAASTEGYYDCILMDIRMPVMDGLTATRTIRAMARADSRKIPIIATTANAYKEDIEAAREAGMNTHIPKPLEPMRLYEALMELLSREDK